jgi:phenylacetate-CoA ligase
MDHFKSGMDRVFKTPLYSSLYESHGINRSDIKSKEDLIKLPTVSKKHINEDYTKAIAKPNDVIKYHTTSGSSGNPTVVAFTENDWDIYTRQNAKCFQLIGATKHDTFYNTTPYGMFFAGFVVHDGAIRLGGKVIPAGTLSTAGAHLSLIKRFNPTVFIGIPQFLLKLGRIFIDEGNDPRELSIKKAYCLGEPLPDKKRELIEDLWDIDIYLGYGLSEIGAGAECSERLGYHWPIDDVLVEVLDEKNGKGEFTYTTLTKTGTLAVRFRSGDLGYIFDESCPCGEKTPLISHIEERIDDLVKIKGTLISPFAVDDAIYSFKDVNNYLFIIDDDEGIDLVRVYIDGIDIDPLSIKKAIYSKTYITPKSITLVEKDSIPLISRKGKRFIDLRKDNPYNNKIRNFEKQI